MKVVKIILATLFVVLLLFILILIFGGKFLCDTEHRVIVNPFTEDHYASVEIRDCGATTSKSYFLTMHSKDSKEEIFIANYVDVDQIEWVSANKLKWGGSKKVYKYKSSFDYQDHNNVFHRINIEIQK